jgi:hypothetical protein
VAVVGIVTFHPLALVVVTALRDRLLAAQKIIAGPTAFE